MRDGSLYFRNSITTASAGTEQPFIMQLDSANGVEDGAFSVTNAGTVVGTNGQPVGLINNIAWNP